MAREIEDLRLFTRIVAAGSLSEAARRLNTSLPSVSRRLAAMEDRLGVRLIDRTTRRFDLTEEGRLLLERGSDILNTLDQLEAEVSASSQSPSGHIRVGVPMEIGRRKFAPLIANFCRLHPLVTIELVLNDSEVDIIGDDLDVGIHADLPADDTLVAHKLLASRRVLCCSPDYIRDHGIPVKPVDLAKHNCILLVRGRHVFKRWKFLHDGIVEDIEVRGSLSSTSSEVTHDWALAGMGIALKAFWDVEEDIAQGRLVEVLPTFGQDFIDLYLIYASWKHLPPRVQVFIKHVIENFEKL
ncbi:LysR family transcriptional regulator [Acetobacter okinawensis]|uniref:LysR family transcriptional regulator n=1 Tax=Acetobacter okinawensis TaxID=1076594 RepID=UPI001BA6C99F|nr:LysR family transcriptional regulator [Acetobacter okinawensis]